MKKGSSQNKKKWKKNTDMKIVGGQLSKRMHRIPRYDKTTTDEEGCARLTTLNKRGLKLTTEKMKELRMGKGGGRRTRFEMMEQTAEVMIRLLEREERNRRRYTPME